MASNAVGSEIKTRVLGYSFEGVNDSVDSPNLPVRGAIFGEANTANQSGLDTSGTLITSAKQAGDLFGYGSPLHMVARIIFPPLGGGSVGSIPVYFFPQAEAGGAAAKTTTLTITGTATANVTHYLKIAGRTGIDASVYAVNIEKDDTNDEIAEKYEDAVNALLSSPMSASSPDESQPSSNIVTLTAKWKGLTSNDLQVEVVTNGLSAGLTYVVADGTAGSGTPSISTALTALGEEWFTHIVNCYGFQSDIIDALETFIGVPKIGESAPSGRYASTIMKPCWAFTGSTLDDPSSLTDAEARKSKVGIVSCPAPNSPGMQFEAAANYFVRHARQMQDNPHLDISGMSLPDMPVPDGNTIGTMGTVANRQAIVLKGCSTVTLNAGAYQVQDFVTTYHPEGEVPLQFDFVRSLVQDFNFYYGYYLLETRYVADHVLANDSDVVTADKVTKPKRWKGILFNYVEDTTKRGLTVNPAFTQAGIVVSISTTNPNRFDTKIPYKRSGIGHVVSTDAVASFNTGS